MGRKSQSNPVAMRIKILYIIASALFILPHFSAAQEKNRLLPDNATLQFAGNTGMLSASAGWLVARRKIQIETGIGYTPRFNAQNSFYSINLKGIYSPQKLLSVGSSSLQLINIGLVTSYSPGNDFTRFLDRDRYPKGYYWFHPWIRYGLVYQAGMYTGFAKGPVESMQIYIEASWWNQGIYSLYSNGNTSYIDLWDITLLGAGLRFQWR
jgi:hypothetical protein